MKNFTHLKGLLCLLLIVVSGSAIKAQTISQTFNSTSTFTVPAGITQVTIEAWGGGGKGGSRSATNNGFGGGGGGAYARKLVTVVPGTTYTVTVGTGATTTAAGNDSWFINATTVLAKGGNSVPLDTSTGATGGAAASCIGDVGGVFSGGNGANGVASTYGGGGGAGAGTINAGATATNATGATGTNGGGNGGNGRSASSGNGTAGSTPGGGGGGALRMTGGGTPTGGNGADGQIIITYAVPEIVVLGNSISITDGDTTPSISDWTDFGSSAIGVGITRTFTIQNTSATAPLSIGAITFSGLGAADYAVTTPPSALVPIGGSTTFVVTFTPSVGGVRNATLSMVNNDPNENPFDFAITGTGLVVGPEMDVQGNAVSIVDGDITPSVTDWTDFTSTPVGNFITRPFTIFNTGTTNLTIGAITFSGLNAADFTVTTAPAATILPGGNTNFVVRFTPGAAGLRTATISIVNNDSNENPYDFALQGTGTEKEIDIQGNATSIVDGDATPSVADFTDYGSTPVGTPVTKSYTILNTGTTNLTIGAITFTGANPGDFSVTTAPSATVTPGSSTTFTVQFNATAAGLRTATISIVNNDSNENPYDFALQGTGTEKEIDVLGNAISIVDGDPTPSLTDWTDFGPVDAISGTTTRTFTIRNTGTTNLTTGAFTFSGPAASNFTLTTPPNATILPGNSSNFTVTFDPNIVGLRSATLSFVNNDSDENPYNFAIQGTGTEQEMDVQGNAISIVNNDNTPTLADWTDFGTSGIGIGVTRTFTILNTGTSPLTIGAVTVGGDFAITTPPTSPVAAGGSTTFVVTYTPTGLGATTANIRIINNDSDENPYRYDVMGTGANLPSEIDIQGSSTSIVDGDITPSLLDWTDFAGSSVGVGVTRTFTIFNTGTGVLTLGARTFTGANAGDFTVVTPPSATVAVGASTTMVIQFTPGAVGVRTATFSIANNDSSENPYDFSIQGTGFAPLTNGPGGITNNLQLWLRSDLLNGTTGVADGTAVNTWNTQARGTDAIKPAAVGAPIYRNNPAYNINFNSVVDFTNNYTTAPQVYTDLDPTRQYLKGTTGFYTQDMYVVLIPDVPMTSAVASNDIFCGDRQPSVSETDGTGLGYGAYTSRISGEVLTYAVGTSAGLGLGYAVADRSSNTYSTAAILNARNNATINGSEFTFNANNVINHTTDPGLFQNVNNSQYWIGRSEGWDGSLDGRVAEIITLSNRASNIEKSNIQSYLAVKYGITLGVNGTSMDYTSSSGTKIWDATANAGFNYDIAGIGRDDISKLNQKQSRSINPTEVMTIGLTDIFATNSANTSTFATNRSYLLWGANGGTMVNSGVNLNVDLGPTTITTITEVVNRKWKVVETGGDVGITRVSIPTAAFLSGLPALGPTDAYVMVVSTNSIFTTGVETVFMTTSGSDQTLLYDFDNTKYITFGVAHQAVNPLHITLDGVDDFVRIGDANELGATFSVMTWIKPNGANTLGTERTILAKKATATTGYQLVLQNDNRVRIEWRGAFGVLQSAVTNTVLPNAMWHNIAVTYGASTLKMYIDGVQDRSVTLLLPPIASTSSFSIGAQYVDKLTINNLFKGDIDELRMWSRVVTQDEIRFIMNQEILQTGTGTRGTIIPSTITKNDINSLLWANLFAYYSMNSYIGTHLDDDSVNINRGSLVIPDKISINLQTAPMPYQTTANGLWSNTATWANGSIQDLPYSLSIVDGVTPIAWNIVRTSHNVDSNGNKNLLGLIVNTNTLSATNDSKLEISHYLKLDGKIDLVGKSQLIQTLNSDLDPTSAGSLERDQQGQKSFYNYNYWSSPVGAINATTNNNAYTVDGVMKDGTTATPQNITWTAGLNGSATSPITLSSYWIFKFQNLTNAYANWQAVGPNGALNPGQGYTLKGSNAATADQNYTFVGKPNNGTITTPIAPNNLNLCGNPYASAIDASAFITANSASTTGTLYFWEHYSTNTSHNLIAYQGGYATRTLVGGTPPVAPPGISGLGSSSKTPGQYIPVGQGFFVAASAAGGNITFTNAQRAFVKENNVLSNTLFRNNAHSTILNANHFSDNTDDAIPAAPNYKKIRLGLNDRNGYHRQILLGFMEENATSGIDVGYDAVHIDSQTNDMYFVNNGAYLNIQGEGFFNANNSYPLGIKTDALGTVTFTLDDKENFGDDFEAFIYDNQTNIFHNIRNVNFSIEVPQGTNDSRFVLYFKNTNALSTTDFDINNGIIVAYTNGNSTLNIKNNVTDTTVEKVTLFNMLGQSITTWDVENDNQQDIQLPIKNLSTGTYIVKIKTDKGDTSKKIVIN